MSVALLFTCAIFSANEITILRSEYAPGYGNSRIYSTNINSDYTEDYWVGPVPQDYAIVKEKANIVFLNFFFYNQIFKLAFLHTESVHSHDASPVWRFMW